MLRASKTSKLPAAVRPADGAVLKLPAGGRLSESPVTRQVRVGLSVPRRLLSCSSGWKLASLLLGYRVMANQDPSLFSVPHRIHPELEVSKPPQGLCSLLRLCGSQPGVVGPTQLEPSLSPSPLSLCSNPPPTNYICSSFFRTVPFSTPIHIPAHTLQRMFLRIWVTRRSAPLACRVSLDISGVSVEADIFQVQAWHCRGATGAHGIGHNRLPVPASPSHYASSDPTKASLSEREPSLAAAAPAELRLPLSSKAPPARQTVST